MPAHMSMHPKSLAQECVNGQQVFNGFGNCNQKSQKQIYSGIFQQQHKDPLLLWFRLSFELHHYCEGMIEMQVILIF